MSAIAGIGTASGWLMLVLAGAGVIYMLAAAIVFRRFFARIGAARTHKAGVTLLKPLYGAEPHLGKNLATFLGQDYSGPVQMLCGIHNSSDAAGIAVEALRLSHPGARLDLVCDATIHGANAKVSNLINMEAQRAHNVLILSDSDMIVPADYISRVMDALAWPNAGAVTCVYRGRGDAGFWSRLGAAGLSYQTLPGAVFGVATGLAKPCMGSTIALDAETLQAIGGFAAFADVLADDYAIGHRVRALGRKVVVPPMLVTHASSERSLVELWRHELRWGATVRDLVPAAYAGAVIGLPVPLALLGALYWPAAGAVLACAALIVRWFVAHEVDRQAGERTAPAWMLPLRDCFSLAVFVASLFVRSVEWRGAVLKMVEHGRIRAGTEQL